MLCNKAPITWKSKMQKTTALSTAEAKYYAASTAGSEVLCLHKLLKRMGFSQTSPTPIHDDNTVGNNVSGERKRAKHIEIWKHFAHEVIQNGEMLLVLVPTVFQLPDIFTKGLHYQQWQACVESIFSKMFKLFEGTFDLKRGG